MKELPIIEKTYELIRWYVPILNRLPRTYKFTLGDRVAVGLYDLLEGLIEARYSSHKLNRLNQMNTQIAKLRYQTRLLFDFELLSMKRYEFASLQLRGIGVELGGWVKQQQN
jgi:hypothetical protein